jgi:hypothetical protein
VRLQSQSKPGCMSQYTPHSRHPPDPSYTSTGPAYSLSECNSPSQPCHTLLLAIRPSSPSPSPAPSSHYLHPASPPWSFPAWSSQNKSCRTNTPKSYILTRGNGAQHAILILGSKGTGANLEDLATSQTPIPIPHRIMTAVLSLLGLLLVIGSALNPKSSSWYLLAVLTLGTIHTAYLAMTTRAPAHYGIPLRFEQVIGRTQVMQTLYAVEHAYPRAGPSMLNTSLPNGGLREDEQKKWEEFESVAGDMNKAKSG